MLLKVGFDNISVRRMVSILWGREYCCCIVFVFSFLVNLRLNFLVNSRD